jgi:NitT/TauT family transport system substrate-binding protein
VAQELLQGEGFTDVRYVKLVGVERALAAGQVDIVTHFCGPLSVHVDQGAPLVLLAGLHPGCVELFGTAEIRSIGDLNGKTVAMTDVKGSRYTFLAVMVAHVGLDPWMVTSTPQKIIAQGADWHLLNGLKRER